MSNKKAMNKYIICVLRSSVQHAVLHFVIPQKLGFYQLI